MTDETPLDIRKIAEDSEYREDLRQRCYRDHFFLARLLGFDKLTPTLHQPCVDLYFPKNPNRPIEDQHPIKNRMHLDPRGTFKTTLGRVDKLQHLLAHPSTVTILNESATQPLARAISRSIAGWLWPGRRGPTPLLAMFPELACDKEPFSASKEEGWNTATHQGENDLDTTLAYTSPGSVQSGWHPYVINADDMVETKNSGIHANPDVRRAVIDTFDTNRNTLRAGGYIYLIGTRYHPFDLYGVKLDAIDRSLWNVLIRESVTVKSGKRLMPGEFPLEDELVCNFEQLPGMDYRSLRELFMTNYESFMGQQQNDPQGGHIATFDEKLYSSSLIDSTKLPMYGGKVYVCWRPTYGGKGHMAKYCEGVAARVHNEKVYVLDCWQGIYTPSRFAEKIVATCKQHQADGLLMMNTPGSDSIARDVRNEAARRNTSVRIQWVDWSDNDDIRAAQIKNLEPLMKVGRVVFSSSMTKHQECRKQFVHYGLIEENGIIECVSKFADLIPLSVMRANMEDEEIEWQRRRRDDAMANAFLQQQGMPQVDETAKRKAIATMQAIEKTSTRRVGPPLPGGLNG